MKWYVIRVVSGKERKIKESIQKELKIKNNENVISNLLIPTQKTIQIRKGKKINIEKNFFPGYIFVECESIDEVESNVKQINGVVSVLKQPVSQIEIDNILGKQEDNNETFIKGDKVKIIDGPFDSFIGDIEDIDYNKQKVKVKVLIFNRETSLNLTFLQIEKN